MRHLLRLILLCASVCPFSGCEGCTGDDSSDEELPPAAPSGFTATAASTERIDLAWVDNATNEGEYRVERSPDGLTWSETAILPADTIVYADRGLTPGTSYSYRVRAVNDGGVSDYAGPASATTPTRVWTGPIQPATRPDRVEHSAIYDAANQRMIVFGGFDTSGFPLNDVWALSLNPGFESWGTGALPTAGSAPPARWQHSAIYDSANKRMVVFGGDDGLNLYADVHCLSLTPGSETWSPLAIAPGPAPAGRTDHTAIYDAANRRMIVFGGRTTFTNSFFNDVWSLSLPSTGMATWTQLAVAFPPNARNGHTAVYDPANQRMILFGGNNGTFNLNDTWTMTLPAASTPIWTLVSAANRPTPRQGHAAIFDAANLRMTLYSGDDGSMPLTTTDTCILNLSGTSSWQVLSTGGPTTGRGGHSAVFDSANVRMVIFGGWDDNFMPFDDVWILRL